MSLFERIQYRLNEESTDSQNQNKKSSRNKKKFGSRQTFSRTVDPNQQQELPFDYSKTGKEDPVKDVKSTRDIIGNRKPKGRRFGSKNRPKETNPNQQLEIPFDDGKKKRAPRKGVDYFFDPDKAKKERDAFQQGRKAYTDSKSGIKAGKVTDKGVIDYITKARNMKQGTNANTKANREAAKVIAKSSGSEYKEKIRTKYETDKDLPRRRGRNQPSYAEIKKGIDARNPVKPGQFTGKPVPANTPVKIIKTTVTDKEIQDIIKQGKQAIPKKSSRVTAAKLGDVDTAIKKIDDLIIEPKAGDAEKTKKLLKKQQRIITKKITTPKPGEIEQQQKILDKTQTKPKVTKVKGNLFDPTGRIADETKKANQSFKDFIKKIKTKHPKPKLSLYDPLKNKIPNLDPLNPLRQPFVKPSITTKTATKSKALLPKLLKAVSKNPKTALGVGLVTLGTYGMLKNRKKTPVKNKNKNLVTPLPTKNNEKIIPVAKTFKITGLPKN